MDEYKITRPTDRKGLLAIVAADLDAINAGFNNLVATRSMVGCIAELKDCDVFISLAHTKLGQYAEEEFDAAWEHFKATGKPWLFTYVKTVHGEITDDILEDLQSLRAFKKKLERMGHTPRSFKDSNDLKLQFVTQLKHLLNP